MELELIEKSATSMEVKVIGENATLLQLMTEKLLDDEAVEMATYVREHPLLAEPVLYVQVNTGKPQTAFKRVAKSISNDVKEFKKLFDKVSA